MWIIGLPLWYTIKEINMKQLKNLIFAESSPCMRAKDNKELMLSVYFLAACVAFVLTASILGL